MMRGPIYIRFMNFLLKATGKLGVIFVIIYTETQMESGRRSQASEELISCVCVTPNLGEATYVERRSQWPGGLGRRSAAARLLTLWVRISPGAFIVCLS